MSPRQCRGRSEGGRHSLSGGFQVGPCLGRSLSVSSPDSTPRLCPCVLLHSRNKLWPPVRLLHPDLLQGVCVCLSARVGEDAGAGVIAVPGVRIWSGETHGRGNDRKDRGGLYAHRSQEQEARMPAGPHRKHQGASGQRAGDTWAEGLTVASVERNRRDRGSRPGIGRLE